MRRTTLTADSKLKSIQNDVGLSDFTAEDYPLKRETLHNCENVFSMVSVECPRITFRLKRYKLKTTRPERNKRTRMRLGGCMRKEMINAWRNDQCMNRQQLFVRLIRELFRTVGTRTNSAEDLKIVFYFVDI